MRPLEHFLIQFGIRSFDKGFNEIFVQDNKYFLISKQIQEIIKKTKKPFTAGAYLGKARGSKFFPSVNLLNMVAKHVRNKVTITNKAAWLFVCGRDLFSEAIIDHTHCVYKGIITFILSEKNEVLGFGKTVKKLKDKGVVIDNIFDIGDFLRREKNKRR